MTETSAGTPQENAAAQAPMPPMQGASETDIGAQAAQGQAAADMPIGAAHADVDELLAQIEAYKAATDARIAALEAEKRAAGGTVPLAGVVASLTDLVSTHAAHTPSIDHGEVLGLVKDLGEAASEAIESGVGEYVAKIGAKIHAWLSKNPPPAGEQPYYRQALDFAGPHLADALDQLEPRSGAPAVGSDRAPAKIIPGNVVGG